MGSHDAALNWAGWGTKYQAYGFTGPVAALQAAKAHPSSTWGCAIACPRLFHCRAFGAKQMRSVGRDDPPSTPSNFVRFARFVVLPVFPCFPAAGLLALSGSRLPQSGPPATGAAHGVIGGHMVLRAAALGECGPLWSPVRRAGRGFC